MILMNPTRHISTHAICVAIFYICFAPAALADFVHLKNGNILQGEVVKEDDDSVVLKLPTGETTILRTNIEFVEKQSPQEYRLDLGRQLLRQDRYESAVQILEDAYKQERNSREVKTVLASAYLMQGKHYSELKRYTEATDSFQKLLKLDPNGELVPNKAAEAIKELKSHEDYVDAMIARGRQLSFTDLNAAIATFEQTISLTPDARLLVSADLAQCHAMRAVQYQKSRRLLNAVTDIEEALRLDPGLADRVERLYVVCVLPGILENLVKGDLTAAQSDIKRVLGFAGNNKNVLYVQARLFEALNNLPSAADYYARGLRERVENPTQEVTAELRLRLEKELGIKGDQWEINTGFVALDRFQASTDGAPKTLETANFTIFHYNDDLAAEVAEEAELDREQIGKALDLPPWKGKAKIYIHRTQAEYTARTGMAEWTGGASIYVNDDGRFSVPQIHSWQTSKRLLKSVLPHEITHLFVNCSLSELGLLPRAMNEGIAILMEPEYRHGYFLDFLRIRLQSDDFIPLKELLAAKNYPRDPEFFYAEGFAVIEYLVNKKSIVEVARIVKNVTTPESAPSEVLRLSDADSLEALETDWKAWILSGK